MNSRSPAQDLIILVADADMKAALTALIHRQQQRTQRTIKFDIYSHPNRDNGVYSQSREFLLSFAPQYRFALIVFDRHGCGADIQSRKEIEETVEGRFDGTSWAGRVAAIAIDPELEAWVWSDSPHVAEELHWSEGTTALRSWLRERDMWPDAMAKPPDPKKALTAARRKTGCPASASLFRQLAKNVSITRCTDPAFSKLLRVLNDWFPTTAPLKR